MSDLISVIVPVYNVEPYLRKCVDSILNQTYRNLEIILVDDGSPDNCGAICDEYAAKDTRIKVIHKINGGLSDARNAGLQAMSGSFLTFVDSDDWIEPSMYESLLTLLLRYDADLAFGGVSDDLEQGEAITTVKQSNYGNTPFSESSVAAMRRYFQGSWAAWDKLYKAELFDGIRFPVGEINEDEAIVLHLLDRCKTVCYTNDIFYHYMRRSTGQSITSSPFSPKKLAWPHHCRENLAFVQEKYPELELDAAARYRGSLLWAFREVALSGHSFPEEVKTLKKELRNNHVLFDRTPFETRTDKLRYLLLKHFPLGVYKTVLRLRHSA